MFVKSPAALVASTLMLARTSPVTVRTPALAPSAIVFDSLPAIFFKVSLLFASSPATTPVVPVEAFILLANSEIVVARGEMAIVVPLILRALLAKLILLFGTVTSVSAEAVKAREFAEILAFNQLTTEAALKVAPAARSRAVRLLPPKVSELAAINVFVEPVELTVAGILFPKILASVFNSFWSVLDVTIRDLPEAPSDQSLFK